MGKKKISDQLICPYDQGIALLKEHYRIGFASKKKFLAVLAHYVIHHIHKLTNLYKFEIDRPSGSREKSEKNNYKFCIASMPKQK